MELVGRVFPCPEWFVLRSSSLFLVGALEQMSELVGRFFPCSEWLVLRSSSSFLVGALEQMFGAIQQMEELLGRFLDVFSYCFWGALPIVFSSCETVTFEPLLRPGQA